MKKSERIKIIMEELEALYPEPGIPLHYTDAFTLLCAVALSAQTTDKKVNEVTPALFAAAPTAMEMALMDIDNVREHIRFLGLSTQKAKNLVLMSQQLIERHGGEVPQSFEALEALAGVGHKTASVVMAQAFDEPAFPVDTHIHRLMTKWKLTSGKNVQETEKDAKRLFPKDKWNKIHLQIILYGRQYSPARGGKERDVILERLEGNTN